MSIGYYAPVGGSLAVVDISSPRPALSGELPEYMRSIRENDFGVVLLLLVGGKIVRGVITPETLVSDGFGTIKYPIGEYLCRWGHEFDLHGIWAEKSSLRIGVAVLLRDELEELQRAYPEMEFEFRQGGLRMILGGEELEYSSIEDILQYGIEDPNFKGDVRNAERRMK